jgi:hypothetical protein
MIIISHRSNLKGPQTAKYGENHPSSIKWALYDGFNVEVDVWYENGKYILGHDKPEYEVDELVLINPLLWLHCKNIEALYKLYEHHQMNSFFHDEDDCVYTSNRFLWCYPQNIQLNNKSVACLPENVPGWDVSQAYGICTDFPLKWK